MTAKLNYDVIVVGGGPAGTSAAITAVRSNLRVLLLERGRFPRHKVCGEFVSSEAHVLLQNLLGTIGISLFSSASRIHQARLFIDGQTITTPVDPPALSITRYDLDALLWEAAENSGCDCIQQTQVEGIYGNESGFSVSVQGIEYRTRTVINGSGRWSNLNAQSIVYGEEPKWIGIKAHFAEADSPTSTDLYFFNGGYCGVQPIASGSINASALVRADRARTLNEVFTENPALQQRSHKWKQLTETVTTSPVLFRQPQPVRDSVLNVGDAAAFIDPFVGDGISLALRSGALAGKLRSAETYAQAYRAQFSAAFRTARWIRWSMSAPPAVRRLLFGIAARTALPAYLMARTR